MLDAFSKALFSFTRRWRRSHFPDGNVNWINSERIGPVGWSIGKHSYANGVRIFGWQKELRVTVGNYCSIAEDVIFLAGGEHDHHAVSTSPYFLSLNNLHRINSKGPIVVENDVWIGHGACILSGVTIHNGSVVAAGAVVTKDVAPYSIVGGVPARLLKMRFDEQTISALLEASWWNWSDTVVRSRAADFLSIDAFLRKYSYSKPAGANKERQSVTNLGEQ